MNVTRTTVSARIWLVVGLCLGVGGCAIGLLTYRLKATSAVYEETLKNLQECTLQQDAARVMQVTFKKQVQEWKDLLLRGYNPEDLKKYSGQFLEESEKVRALGEALATRINDPAARQTVQDFLTQHAAMKEKYEASRRIFGAAKGNNPHEADRRVRGQDRAATDLLDKVVDQLRKRSNIAVASQSAAVAGKIWTVSIAVVAAFMLIGFVAALTIRRISATLLNAVRHLREVAGHVAGTASQVSGTSQSLAQGSNEQAASLEETSASSEEINSMARKNSENSRSAAGLVASSQHKFAETSSSLEQTVTAMGEISAQSGKVSKIIRTIDEIAFQTNILALNAAVEAARAGEAGMGFSVVADEVRNLAQRCAQAARDTAVLIEESVAKSNDGKNMVDEVAVSIRGIIAESAKVKILVDEVNQGSQEQARGIEQIGKAITQMEQVTQRTAASAEESASAAEELSAQSETLKGVVAQLSAMVGVQ